MTISNEAVESAARAMRDLYAQEVCELPVESFFKEARAALEAAAWLIRAECLEETAAAWDTRTATLLETMKGMAESRNYTHEDIIRYGAYSAEAQITAARLRARAVAERGRQ